MSAAARKNPDPYPRTPTEVADLHPLVVAAAKRELPDWAKAGKKRRAHMDRVAALMEEWARARGLSEVDVIRWGAVGYLHDALRDAPPKRLRPLLSPAFRDAPGNLLHGPAAAFYLEREGVRDYEFLDAVRYHTVGHPSLREMGRALYLADFLEPGRKLRPKFRARLRERMPSEMPVVLKEIVAARIQYLVDSESAIRAETLSLWNTLADG